MPLIALSISIGVVRLLDVVGAHALQDVAEKIELPVELGVLDEVAEYDARHVQQRGRAGQAGHEQERPEREFRLAHYPCTFSMTCHPPWVWVDGRPSLRNST